MKTRTSRFLNLALALALLFSMQIACGAAEDIATETEAPVQPTDAPVTAGQPGSWLVMMYQDADDQILEKDIYIDLNEAEIVGSTDQVKVVAQIDRYKGAYDGGGDWTSAKRFLVTQDSDLETIASEELADLGEVDMGNKDTLIDFAAWAIQNYPADHYVLILSDHGAGWDGGWTDDDPVEGSALRMQDVDEALGTILTNTGIGAFELVGFDACLMGQLEVVSSIAPHARFAVGSQETEPSLGWAYAQFLQALNDNTAMTGRELGQTIVEGYIDQDFRITDDQARSVYSADLGATGDVSAEEIATYLSKDITLAAYDLGAVQDLNSAVNGLGVALTNIDQNIVAEARSYAQSYTSIFGGKIPPSYIDLGHFVDLIQSNTDDSSVTQAAQQVQSVLKQVVVAEKHGSEKPASSGLTIYFPNSELYQLTFGDGANVKYTAYVGRFATASLWDDYLTFHYTGESFDPATADLTVLTPAQFALTDFTKAAEASAPLTGAEVVPPGAGTITIAPITVSASQIGPDGKVTLSTEITGTNIGYIYYYVSYFDKESNSYLTADEGYISADNTKQVGGIYYPDWGNEGKITLDYEWEPTLYFMSDGTEANDQFAFFEPEVYGADENGDIYTVSGTYKFIESGSELDAVIKFSGDGKMQSVFGFNGEDGSGAPREITPQAGDTFNITEEWLDFDQNPEGEFVDYVGGTMTFGDNRFAMVPYYAYSGAYTLGIIVEDLNGNTYEEFVEVTVTE